MLDSEEQVQQRLPIPLPRANFESLDESNEETEEDVPTVTPSTSDLVDGDPKVPSSSTQSLADQIHALTTRFDAYWDESQEHRVAHSQDMDSIRDEMAAIHASQDQITQQLAQLLSFSHNATTATTTVIFPGCISLPFCFIFFSTIEDTVSFKFGGMDVWGVVYCHLSLSSLFSAS